MKTEKWKPKLNTHYYCIDLAYYKMLRTKWEDDSVDNFRYKISNCYKTRAEANKKLKLINAILKQP